MKLDRRFCARYACLAYPTPPQPNDYVERKAVHNAYEEYFGTGTGELLNAATFGKLVRKVFPDLKDR